MGFSLTTNDSSGIVIENNAGTPVFEYNDDSDEWVFLGENVTDVGTLAADVLSSPIVELGVFKDEDLPSSPVNGSLSFDEDRGLPAWFDVDHYEWPTFVDDVLTSPVTVSDTTVRTTVFNPDINANSLIEGRTYQLDVMGTFSTANNSADFTVDVSIAGEDAAGIGNVGGNVTDAPWSVEFTFTVTSDGSSGTIQTHTRGLFNSEPADAETPPVSVDTSSATELEVDIQWNEADPGNSVEITQAHLKQMG